MLVSYLNFLVFNQTGEVDNKKLTEARPIFFQLIERLSQDNEKLMRENQQLRDKTSLLKGEQGKPKIRGFIFSRDPKVV